MARSDRKQREFERREREIVEAAHALFKQGDIHAVTIEQIAEAADIGKGTVYKHFQSKDEIYARIIIQLNRAMRADIAAIDNDLPFRKRLDRIIEVIWEHDMRDSQFLRRLNIHVMTGNFRQNLGPEMLAAMQSMQQEDGEFYLQLLAEAQQRGEIVEAPLEELLFCASSAIDGAILKYWFMESGGDVTAADSQRFLRHLQDFVYRALTGRNN
ncbi:MAG: helix-turn-helix transcriptional regulator [Gammaproteobacteria bacterium]|nr:helix-turn-helix transcriptional regulator [Gammaproteobacteria bacterium]